MYDHKNSGKNYIDYCIVYLKKKLKIILKRDKSL